jgi:hypothetical protein
MKSLNIIEDKIKIKKDDIHELVDNMFDMTAPYLKDNRIKNKSRF